LQRFALAELALPAAADPTPTASASEAHTATTRLIGSLLSVPHAYVHVVLSGRSGFVKIGPSRSICVAQRRSPQVGATEASDDDHEDGRRVERLRDDELRA
jgi:hypothetical protein